MKNPTGCVLWSEPARIDAGPVELHCELLETFADESHWWRYLLKCRECGQLYVYEFYEEVDWADSDDSTYVTWVPVDTADDIEAQKAAPPGGLAAFVPRLCRDWPKGAKQAKICWVKGQGD